MSPLTTIVGISTLPMILGIRASMFLRTTREIGLLVHERRREVGLTQAQLAEQVGASREWVRLLESGRPRLDLGLTLRALHALGLVLDAQPAALPSAANTTTPKRRRRK
jgi:y4mF family transcriptional regulator